MSFRNILAYSPPERAEASVETAARLARATGARLKLIDIVKPLPVYLREPTYGYPALSDTLVLEAQETLQERARSLLTDGINTDIAVRTGKPYEEIVRESQEAEHDLVVTPASDSHRSTSTAVRLCHLCPAPVLSVGEASPFRKILATVDPLTQDESGRELNQRVINTALEAARAEGGEVSVLYVWGEDLPPGSLETHGDAIRGLAESALHDLVKPYAADIQSDNVLLEFGNPSRRICQAAEEHGVDLIVLGAIARAGVQALIIGNTAEKTLSAWAGSSLVIKPAGYVTPVRLSS